MTASTFEHNKFIGNFLKIRLGQTGGEGAYKKRMGGERTHRRTRDGWEANVHIGGQGADGRRTCK